MATSLFRDAARWSRADRSLHLSDLMPVLISALAWTILALSSRVLLESLEHSPIQYAALAWMIAIALVVAVPVVLTFTPHRGLRRAVRAAASLLAFGAGCLILGFIAGMWMITRAPGLLTDYAWEATLPSLALLAIGTAGIISLAPRFSAEETDQ